MFIFSGNDFWLLSAVILEGSYPSRVFFLTKVDIAKQVINLTSIHEDAGSIPGLTQWVKDPALLRAML